jgi:DNA-binding NtrC family response regulator
MVIDHNISHWKNNNPYYLSGTMLELHKHKRNHNGVRSPLWRVLPSQRKKSFKLLVINDEGRVEQLLEDILTSGGHTVKTVPNGSAGLTLYKNNTFDVVFINEGISGMPPWKVLKEIRKVSKPACVVLVLGWKNSSGNQPEEKREFDGIIKTPFSLNQVLKLVEDIAQGKT